MTRKVVARPNSIVAFERLWFGSLAVSLVKIAATSDEAAVEISAHYVAAVVALTLVVTVALIFLISRRRSRIAKWALTALFALGLAAYLPLLQDGIDSAATLVEVLLAIVQAVALGCLFTPSARAWFDAARDGTPAIDALERTFE